MERQILGYKCTKCGTVHYPNRARCRKCHGLAFDTVPLELSGKLVTFTRLYTLPPDYEVATLLLGIVDLGHGVRLTGQLDLEQPKIGMKVSGRVDKVRQLERRKLFGVVFSAA